MADAMEAIRQDVLQEPPGKLGGGKRHDPISRFAMLAIILDSERHTLAIIGRDPAVRDGDPVGVSGQV